MLNKQKGNMYGFITHTWNTIKGKCPHNCSYCYMKRFKQTELHFDEKELKTNLGKGNFIFVGSGCDMFAESIGGKWIEKTIRKCLEYNQNEYLFQSRNISKLVIWIPIIFSYPNFTIATTIETNRENNLSVTPNKYDIDLYFKRQDVKKMITIEPIMDFDLVPFVEMIKNCNPIQVNVGANSIPKIKLPEPEPEKVLELISELEKFTKVYQKDNLKRLFTKRNIN